MAAARSDVADSSAAMLYSKNNNRIRYYGRTHRKIKDATMGNQCVAGALSAYSLRTLSESTLWRIIVYLGDVKHGMVYTLA